jgi:SPP1 gp7 family putative phage head morphogenesis protein
MPYDPDSVGLDDGTELQRLMRRFYPVLIDRAFGDASGVLGLDVAFDVDNPHVQDVLKQLTKRVKGITDSTREELRTLLGQAADEGWSVAKIAERIREHAATMSRSRAETIARTETAAAYSLGSKEAWRQSGVVDRMEWHLGPKPCAQCQALGGAVISIDDKFADAIVAPPAHPNCTCVLLPVLKE